jgi:hypothetical protein
MDSRVPNTDQLDRLESKLDELLDNQAYINKSDARFQGVVYGLLGGYGLAILTSYLGWF